MPIAKTDLGDVEGVAFDGYQRFAGIRYAQAPVGPRRFRPPVPVDPWGGVYDARDFGASAPQAPLPNSVGVQRDLVTDEDCLFLNVFTPAADDGRRPVMVWVHGGAYTIGSGDIYDGASFCLRGDVVVVTMNYRLGALGWLPLEHLDASYAGSGNNGIRDQIEVLRWVRAHIGAFGGDPSNVTLFGESAGGGSVFALLAAPDADGLYQRVIIQSGVPGFGPPDSPEEMTDEILDALGAPGAGLPALLEAPAERLVAAQARVGAFDRMGIDERHVLAASGPGFHPVVDGVVITRTAEEAIVDKADHNVAMLVGTNLDEGSLFTLVLPQQPSDDQISRGLSRSTADPARVLAAYRARGSGRPLLVELFTETIFRIPTLRAVDALVATGTPAWVYLFTWPTPVFGNTLGATHALEIPFAWHMLGDETWRFLVGRTPPVELADAMHDAWLAFARAGDPNHDGIEPWPVYDTVSRPTFEFGERRGVVHDPVGDLRELWYETAAVRAGSSVPR